MTFVYLYKPFYNTVTLKFCVNDFFTEHSFAGLFLDFLKWYYITIHSFPTSNKEYVFLNLSFNIKSDNKGWNWPTALGIARKELEFNLPFLVSSL